MSVEMSQGVATDDKNRAESRDKGATTLRPTTLTTLIEGEEVWIATPPDPHRYTKLARKYAAERCIHELPLDRCAVCNGYARWLVAGGEERLSEARSSPESTRRLYWRLIDGGEVRERSW